MANDCQPDLALELPEQRDAVSIVEVNGAGLASADQPFLRRLQRPAIEGLFNPWCDANADDYVYGAPYLRRWLLAQHLNFTPRLVLVGEAPGYRGCRISGIPFTSERQIRTGRVPRVSEAYVRVFGNAPITPYIGGWAEPSATIVWNVLRVLGLAADTILWNACPWHPYVGNNPLTNRAPTMAELDAGLPVLCELLDDYAPDAHIIAVGNLANFQLERAGVGDRYLGRARHPAFGGASSFREDVQRLLGVSPGRFLLGAQL